MLLILECIRKYKSTKFTDYDDVETIIADLEKYGPEKLWTCLRALLKC